ncbi:MAG TPA: hypothetical protein PK957_01205 [Candidatus Dojkabacteria bacterium]|nr:hypothetical protein [Candidatus Dojkabacteria bacterium]HQF36433.1 hypothetical protein [Candidatus Dojkabacteria bacterium]
MNLSKLLIIAFIVAICSFFLYKSYLTVKDLNARKVQRNQIERDIEDERFDYLIIMLQEKEIVENTDAFIEMEARLRLKYAKADETVVYYGNEFDSEYWDFASDLNYEEPVIENIELWKGVLLGNK